jgi:hypothetical protein
MSRPRLECFSKALTRIGWGLGGELPRFPPTKPRNVCEKRTGRLQTAPWLVEARTSPVNADADADAEPSKQSGCRGVPLRAARRSYPHLHIASIV